MTDRDIVNALSLDDLIEDVIADALRPEDMDELADELGVSVKRIYRAVDRMIMDGEL